MWKDGEEVDLKKFNRLCEAGYERLSDEITSDRGEWREKTSCVDPKRIGTRARRKRRNKND
jgi:hypothetical protein